MCLRFLLFCVDSMSLWIGSFGHAKWVRSMTSLLSKIQFKVNYPERILKFRLLYSHPFTLSWFHLQPNTIIIYQLPRWIFRIWSVLVGDLSTEWLTALCCGLFCVEFLFLDTAQRFCMFLYYSFIMKIVAKFLQRLPSFQLRKVLTLPS